MAPSLEAPLLPQAWETKLLDPTPIQGSAKLKYEPGRTVVKTHENYEYEDLRPRFPDIQWPPLEEVPYYDRGLDGAPDFHNLLEDATDIVDYNPKIGTEIHGVNLARLTDAQKNDLARLIATRGVVFFRNQEEFDIEAQRELGKYYGNLHRHATTAVPRREGLEDVHVVYTDEKSQDMRAIFTPTFLWHSDVGSIVPSYFSADLRRSPTKFNRHHIPL